MARTVSRGSPRHRLHRSWGIVTSGVIVVSLTFVVTVRAAVFTQPSGSAPYGSLGTPLFTDQLTQTKSGGLTLQKALTITNAAANPNLSIGTSVQHRSISWNGVMLDDWSSIIGTLNQQFVRIQSLFNQSEVGYASITGPDAAGTSATAGLTATAPTASGTPPALYAIEGLSYNQTEGGSTANLSYGVYGAAGANSPTSIGVKGVAGDALLAWAGYFHGHLAVASGYDLIVGGTLPPNRNGIGEVCLNDVCKSAWPAPNSTDQYWNDAGTELGQLTTTYQLGVGDIDPVNHLQYQVLTQPVPSQGAARFSVTGAGVSNTMTIGAP